MENAEAIARRYPAAARVAKAVQLNGGAFEGMVKLGFAAKLIEEESVFLRELKQQVLEIYRMAAIAASDPATDETRNPKMVVTIRNDIYDAYMKIGKRMNKIRPDRMSECKRVDSAVEHGLIIRLTPVYARIAKFEITDLGREVAKFA